MPSESVDDIQTVSAKVDHQSGYENMESASLTKHSKYRKLHRRLLNEAAQEMSLKNISLGLALYVIL